jgi:hypothetical protein
MPLIKGYSNKTFGKNFSREMKRGHSRAQSLAIAYSVKKKALAAKRKRNK